MIYFGRYDPSTKQYPSVNGAIPILIHPGKTNRYASLSPYEIRDNLGRFVENVYQFSKLYRQVYYQNQSSYMVGHYGKVNTWSHPTETHIISNPNSYTHLGVNGEYFTLTPEYYKWQQKGYYNQYAIRYPNGYTSRHECVGLLWNNQILNYVNGRYVYINAYMVSNIRSHTLYLELLNYLKNGQNLLILEVDGPKYHTSAPYNQISDQNPTLLVTPETLRQARFNPDLPFGHGWIIAAMLLGIEMYMY